MPNLPIHNISGVLTEQQVSLTSGVSGTLPLGNGGTGVTGTPANGQVLIGNGTGFALGTLTAGSGIAITNSSGGITIATSGAGTGTVTSVGLSAPSEFSVSGSPVTGSGTLALSWSTQAANTVHAGPTTGSAAAPTFRSLVAADIPGLDASKIISGVLPVAYGGTGTSNRTLTNSSSTTTVDWQGQSLAGGDWSTSAGFSLGTSSSTTAGTMRYESTGKTIESYVDGIWRGTRLNPSREFYFFDDFVQGYLANGSDGWSIAAGSGSSFNISQNGAQSHFGVIQGVMGTASPTAARFSMGQSAAAITFGGGICVFETSIQLSAIATASDDYKLWIGWIDNIASTAESVDGVYIEYDRSSSANWRLVASNASTRTRTTGTTAVSANWTRLKIIVNASASSAEFFVDDVSQGTVATNIPTANYCGIGVNMVKVAGTAQNYNIKIDYISSYARFTSLR